MRLLKFLDRLFPATTEYTFNTNRFEPPKWTDKPPTEPGFYWTKSTIEDGEHTYYNVNAVEYMHNKLMTWSLGAYKSVDDEIYWRHTKWWPVKLEPPSEV